MTTYLRICDTDDDNMTKARAFQELAHVLRIYAQATDRWDVVDAHRGEYFRGQSKVHCEYDSIYLRVDDLHLSCYLAGCPQFKGRWRRVETVHVFATL